jgi:hypothetical protein
LPQGYFILWPRALRSGYYFFKWNTLEKIKHSFRGKKGGFMHKLLNLKICFTVILMLFFCAIPLEGFSNIGDNEYTIFASASPALGGSISPAGAVRVRKGESKTFTITPNPGYWIYDVQVDGVEGIIPPTPDSTSYTFTNVTANHSIRVSFMHGDDKSIYLIHAFAVPRGAGMISPNGAVMVKKGKNTAFTITPNSGYKIKDVFVDDKPQGALTEYTFTNVTTSHNIGAFFIPTNVYSIFASADGNGGIDPFGEVFVTKGADQEFTITPSTSLDVYKIKDVVVDGISQGPLSTYTFENVTAKHTIKAFFELDKNTYRIDASVFPSFPSSGGTISPAGEVFVPKGGKQKFVIMPNLGFKRDGVSIDGVLAGNLTEYTFTNVTKHHYIVAFFKPDSSAYTIEADAAAGGTIKPDGLVPVQGGKDQTFTVTADQGFKIGNVDVDGKLQGALNEYTFKNVSANHSITAYFKLYDDSYITSTSTPGDVMLSSSGAVSVGENIIFVITPQISGFPAFGGFTATAEEFNSYNQEIKKIRELVKEKNISQLFQELQGLFGSNSTVPDNVKTGLCQILPDLLSFLPKPEIANLAKDAYAWLTDCNNKINSIRKQKNIDDATQKNLEGLQKLQGALIETYHKLNYFGANSQEEQLTKLLDTINERDPSFNNTAAALDALRQLPSAISRQAYAQGASSKIEFALNSFRKSSFYDASAEDVIESTERLSKAIFTRYDKGVNDEKIHSEFLTSPNPFFKKYAYEKLFKPAACDAICQAKKIAFLKNTTKKEAKLFEKEVADAGVILPSVKLITKTPGPYTVGVAITFEAEAWPISEDSNVKYDWVVMNKHFDTIQSGSGPTKTFTFDKAASYIVGVEAVQKNGACSLMQTTGLEILSESLPDDKNE